ncbi:MAG: hypothetical protein ABSH44_02395 [Bryobacteraceae bacterium]|jgi:hypothetical protein
MNLELIGHLVRLRYKLLWAKTRSRNGRIALFMVCYLLLVLLIAVLAAGGFGAALVAVRTGKAEMVARAVLSGLYVQAVMAAVILGFGVNAIFSEAQLRRYPLKAHERRVARHFIGILDPFWFLILALELGLVVGLYVSGAASFWLGLIAVLLLLLSSYLFARVVALLVERLMQRKFGAAVLLAAAVSVGFLPAILRPVVGRHRGAIAAFSNVLGYTPPFGAAATMTRTDLAALYGLALQVCWILGLAAALVALERRPPQRPRAAQTVTISWDTPYDRLAAFFGPRLGPLMAHWLRFYLRNNRFRTIYALALPIAATLIVTFGRRMGTRGHPGIQFAGALSAFAVLGCMGTAQLAVNQFGYVAGGFRRFFLLPAQPAIVLRAGSYTFLLMNSALILAGTLLFVLFSPLRFDARMLIMLVGGAVTSLFVFLGLGLWATLFGPRCSDYYSSFGNDLSAAGNAVVIGGILMVMFAPQVLAQIWPAAVAPDKWWVAVPMVLLAAAFYFSSLERASALLMARREKLLAVVEGRG